jgi:Putative adhesin
MGTRLIDSPQRLALDGEVTQLDVWFAHGKLRVVGTDGPARIEAKKVGRKGITVTQENGMLSVRHPIKHSKWWGWGPFWWFLGGRRNFTADVIVAVPQTVPASLTVVAGDVVASGLRSGATVDVTSGSITVMGLGGTVRTKTVSGSIEAMGVSGDLVMETVSGEISLAESSAERVHARTISGAVTCDLDNPFARDVHIDTTSGSITVRVPDDADLEVSLGATSGRITSGFPQIRASGMPGSNYASGRIGTGSGTLRAYAVSGSVSLLARPSGDFGPDSDEDTTP